MCVLPSLHSFRLCCCRLEGSGKKSPVLWVGHNLRGVMGMHSRGLCAHISSADQVWDDSFFSLIFSFCFSASNLVLFGFTTLQTQPALLSLTSFLSAHHDPQAAAQGWLHNCLQDPGAEQWGPPGRGASLASKADPKGFISRIGPYVLVNPTFGSQGEGEYRAWLIQWLNSPPKL